MKRLVHPFADNKTRPLRCERNPNIIAPWKR
jgi:hypothetical protein